MYRIEESLTYYRRNRLLFAEHQGVMVFEMNNPSLIFVIARKGLECSQNTLFVNERSCPFSSSMLGISITVSLNEFGNESCDD
jgi:hypothetical protein